MDETFTRENLFAFVGRFNQQKNPILALEGFKIALEKGLIPKNSKMMMIGDGPLKGEIQKFANAFQISKSIVLTGFLE